MDLLGVAEQEQFGAFQIGTVEEKHFLGGDSIAQRFGLKEVSRTDLVGNEHGMSQPYSAVPAVGDHLGTEKEAMGVVGWLHLREAELADNVNRPGDLFLSRRNGRECNRADQKCH